MKRLVVWAVVASLPGSLAAETVFLRNGQYVVGEILAQSRESITLGTSAGVKTIPKVKIRRILYTTTSPDDKQKLEERARAAAKRREQERLAREKAHREALAAEALRRQKAQEAAREEAARQAAAEAKRKKANSGLLSDRSRAALWRSALLPGWGQHYQERTQASYIFGGIAGGSAFLTWYFYRDYTPKRSSYESTSTSSLVLSLAAPDSIAGPVAALAYSRVAEARNQMETSGSRSNLFLTAFILTWAANLGDVILFESRGGAAVYVSPGQSMQLGLRIQF